MESLSICCQDTFYLRVTPLSKKKIEPNLEGSLFQIFRIFSAKVDLTFLIFSLAKRLWSRHLYYNLHKLELEETPSRFKIYKKNVLYAKYLSII